MKDHHIYYHNTTTSDTFHTQTTIDLNLEEIFNRIDFTSSAYGRQYLYKHLFEKQNSIIHSDIQKDKNKIKSLNTIKCKQLLECSNEPIDYQLINLLYNPITILKSEKILSYISIVLLIVGVIGINFHFLFCALFCISIILNKQFIDRKKTKKLSSRETLTNIIKFINAHEEICKVNLEGIKSEKGMPKLQLHRYIQKLNNNDSSKLSYCFIAFLKIMFPIENLSYIYYLNNIKNHNHEFINAYEKIGYFDLITNIIEIEKAYKTCTPSYSSIHNDVQLTNSYHPLIENYITNSFKPQYKDTIITGATMSGKTTFLKQIAVNVLLGQKLGICFAEKAVITDYPVCTFMNSSDNFLGGISHYYSQLARMKNIMDICKNKKHLIIIDNVFTECNASEQVAINYSILKELSKIAFLLITTTNDPNLLKMLIDYNNYYFDSHYSKIDNAYNCSIKEGIKLTNNSICIAQEIGMPTSVVEDARELHSALKTM